MKAQNTQTGTTGLHVASAPESKSHRVAEPIVGVLPIPAALVEVIAERVVDLLADRLDRPSSGYLGVDAAAAYLACGKQRVYDLVHEGRLAVSRDGRRLLFTRTALDAALTHDAGCHPVATPVAGADEHGTSGATGGPLNRMSEAA